MLEGHFGVPAAGLILVAINTRLGKDEVSYIVEHSGAKMVFVDAELNTCSRTSKTSSGCASTTRARQRSLRGLPGGGLAGAGRERARGRRGDHLHKLHLGDHGAAGRHVHPGGYLSALGNVIEIGMDYDTNYLWTLPMFHCNGWTFPWAVTAVAGTHVCLRKVEPARIWELFDDKGSPTTAQPRRSRSG